MTKYEILNALVDVRNTHTCENEQYLSVLFKLGYVRRATNKEKQDNESYQNFLTKEGEMKLEELLEELGE